MKTEAYDMVFEMRSLKSDTKEYIDKMLKAGWDGDSLRHISEKELSMIQDTFNIIERYDNYLEKSIDFIEKALEEQYETNRKIDEIYRSLKTK